MRRCSAIMAKLVGVECPQCGAKLKIDPGQHSATCEYCNTTSSVQRGAPPPPRSGEGQAPAPRIIYVERRSSLVLFVGAGVVLAIAIAGFAMLRPSPGTSPSPSQAGAPPISFPPELDPGETDFFTGLWNIRSASNPGSTAGYKGVVDVRKIGQTYHLAWSVDNTAPYRGVGIATDAGIGVGWGLGADFGVAVYDIDGGRLEGRWANRSSRRTVGIESLVGPATLDGSYDIDEGRAPDGSTYDGQVVIEPRGDTYVFRWKLQGGGPSSDASYTGIGIKDGDQLVVGWGAAGSGSGVVAYRKASEALSGSWAHPDASTLGTENLGR